MAEPLLTLAENPPFAEAALVDSELVTNRVGGLSAQRVVTELSAPDLAEVQARLNEGEPDIAASHPYLHEFGQAIIERAEEEAQGGPHPEVVAQLMHATPERAQRIGLFSAARYVAALLWARTNYGEFVIADAAWEISHHLIGDGEPGFEPATQYRPEDREAVADLAWRFRHDADAVLEELVRPALDHLEQQAAELSPAAAATYAADFWTSQLEGDPRLDADRFGDRLPVLDGITAEAFESDLADAPPLVRTIVENAGGETLPSDTTTPLEHYGRGVRRAMAFVAFATTVAARPAQ